MNPELLTSAGSAPLGSGEPLTSNLSPEEKEIGYDLPPAITAFYMVFWCVILALVCWDLFTR